MPLNSSCQDFGFTCPFVVIDLTDLSNDGGCLELAPGLMFDNFLPIPDAESLPFYPLVLKLVGCVYRVGIKVVVCYAVVSTCIGPTAFDTY